MSVPENADFEGTVADLDVSDQDRDKNGMFTCSMENMDLETMDTFTVRKTPKGCALVLTGYLEWSTVNRYSLSVRATDHAEAAQRMSAVASGKDLNTSLVNTTHDRLKFFVMTVPFVEMTCKDAALCSLITVLKGIFYCRTET